MTGTLLAIGFYTPWMLAGVLLASLPVIIHYWFRRNYQVTEWAAIQFLLSAVEKHSRRIRLEQFILLSIRVLILLLIAVAMAEPFLSGGEKTIHSTGSVRRVLVLDASYSMGKRDFKETHFEKAKSVALDIVQNSSKGDFLSLFQISSATSPAIIPEPTLYHNTISRELNQLELTDETGDLVKTIESIKKSFNDQSDNSNCEVIILSDMQKSLWNPVSDSSLKELNQQLNTLSQSCQLRLIDVGDDKAANLAVTSLKLEDTFVVVDRPASFSAEIRNFGNQPVKGEFVELFVDGHLAETLQINIPAGERQSVSFSHLFGIQGKHHLELRLAEDALPADQHRWLSVSVQKSLKVLLVNGRKAESSANQATFYLQTALSSQVTSGEATGIFDVELVQGDEWDRVNLKNYDSVFLVDMPNFQPEESSRLREYVSSGGGLVLFMGNQVDVRNYNQWNLKNEKGFLPVELLGSVKTNQQDQVYHFVPENYRHPVLKPFEGNPGTGLESTVVLDYMKVKLNPEFPTKVAFQYDSGDPVLTETSFEKGKIFLVTTSADISWGTWAVQPSFPPVVYELVKHSVSGRWEMSELLVGTTFQIRFPQLKEGTPVSVTLPDGEKVSSLLTELQEQSGLLFSKTTQAGIYQIDAGQDNQQISQFAVNLDTNESDLKRVPFETIKNQLSVESQITYSKKWDSEQGPLSVASEIKTGLNTGLIMLVLCLFFVELFMAWKFSYGLGLLTFFGLSAFIFITARTAPFLGWGVFVISLIVILFVNRGRIQKLSSLLNCR